MNGKGRRRGKTLIDEQTDREGLEFERGKTWESSGSSSYSFCTQKSRNTAGKILYLVLPLIHGLTISKPLKQMEKQKHRG